MKRRIQKTSKQSPPPSNPRIKGLHKDELIRHVAGHIQTALAKEALLEARSAQCQARSSGETLVLPKSSMVLPAKPKSQRSLNRNFRASILAVMLGIGFFNASAQITITTFVKPGSEPPIPVSLSGFTGEAAQVLEFDLHVQGFSITTPDKAQYAISGSANGDIKGTVVDQVSKQTKLSRAYSGVALRRQAHAFADDVVQAITGRKGIGLTKIAFKADTGGNSEIYIADFDGFNAQAVTRDNTIVAAPAFVPGKLALYYTSYKLGNPDIFFQDLSSGQRKTIARYSGLNTSASVSPDGSRIAMILSKGGSPDVYVANADGSGLVQLTKTREDESSPCWSPDGQWICFAGKKSERRALWKVPAAGGTPQMISTAGVRNPSEPDWSPDGKWIVFTSQMGDFNICVIPSKGGDAIVLTTGEDPSWAPNSRTVAFARRSGGRRVLALLDMPTKQVKDASRTAGGNSQPSWAKYPKEQTE
jgi:TolB protein